MQTDESSTQTQLYYSYVYQNHTPTAEEIQATEELLEYLQQNGLYDTEEATLRRNRVISRLFAMVKAWAVSIGTAKGVQDDLLIDGGGIQIQIFGSTKLEVHNYSSDMDLLCIAPSFLTKSDFFSSFCDTLSACPDIDNLLSIPEAYTPVIKFVMMGISIDLVFASLQFPKLNGIVDTLDLRCLRGLDEQAVRSLNGIRVAEWICKLVPNIQTYRVALRAIKHWATQRGVYSNVLGFLGGVNYAILVAMICQQFQNATPFVLIQKFFSLYTYWPWPTPVILRRFEDLNFKDSDGKYLPVWNPVSNFKDSLHIMPIITPAYPSMNSAYNVGVPQFRCIQEEFVRGNDIFQNHVPGQPFPWSRLFESSTVEFFGKFPRYIQIDVSAPNAVDHRKWFGWVESRLRLLIVSLEQPPAIYSHPIANCFHRQPGQKLTYPTNLHNNVNNSPSPLTNSPDTTEDVLQSQIDGLNSISNNNNSNLVNIVTPSGMIPTDPSTIVISTLPPYTTPRKSVDTTTATAIADNVFTSSFFVGLSFGLAQHSLELSSQINEFLEKTNGWTNHRPDMKLSIALFDRDSVPEFIHSTKAEPSGMESCTPNINRYPSSNSSHQHHLPGNGSTDRILLSGSGSQRSPRSHHHHHNSNNHHTMDPMEDQHQRLIASSMQRSESYHSHTISYEMPEDDEQAILVRSRSDSIGGGGSSSLGTPHHNHPHHHPTTGSVTHPPKAPYYAYSPRNNSNRSTHSGFDNIPDMVGPVLTAPAIPTTTMTGHHTFPAATVTAAVPHHFTSPATIIHPVNYAHHVNSSNYQTSSNSHHRSTQSPRYLRSKIPQSPKSNHSHHSNNNNSTTNGTTTANGHLNGQQLHNNRSEIAAFPQLNGAIQPKPQRHQYSRNHHHGSNSNHSGGSNRRPSSGNFSSSSTEIEDPVTSVPTMNTTAPVITTTTAAKASLSHPAGNGIAQIPNGEELPPLKFGLISPGTATAAASAIVSNSDINHHTATIHNDHEVMTGNDNGFLTTASRKHDSSGVPLELSSPSSRITPKRSRNDSSELSFQG